MAALLGAELSSEEREQSLEAFYHYIDLSNEQVFLRMHRRVSKSTWQNWCSGIRSHLERPAFAEAWAEIKNRADHNFSELRRLEESRYKSDPASWASWRDRVLR